MTIFGTWLGVALAASLLVAAPAAGTGVRAGIEAWQRGDHAAAVAA